LRLKLHRKRKQPVEKVTFLLSSMRKDGQQFLT
jgi:hypothetical protein